LASYGYVAANLEPELPLAKRHNRVGFVDESTLAISFVAPAAARPQLSTRSTPSSYLLHVALADVDSGDTLLSTTWPTRVNRSGIQVLADGNLLLSSGETITLYSRGLKQLAQARLNAEGLPELVPSVSGKTLWTAFRDDGKTIFEVRSARDLEVQHRWEERNAPARWSASDDSLVARFDTGQMQLRKRTAVSDWNKIFVDYGCYSGIPSYVGDDRMILPACQELFLLDARGRVLATERLLRGERMDPEVAAARDGSIVAVSLRDGIRGTRRILVYDVTHGLAVGSVAVALPQGWNYAVAVSPDGERLAVLTDGVVSVYNVASLTCGIR
jgi:hypothetical protein